MTTAFIVFGFLGVVALMCLFVSASANDKDINRLMARVKELERRDSVREKREDAARLAAVEKQLKNGGFVVETSRYDYGPGGDGPWHVTVHKDGTCFVAMEYPGKTKAQALEDAFQYATTIERFAKLYAKNLT